jgi:hypothetical protein
MHAASTMHTPAISSTTAITRAATIKDSRNAKSPNVSSNKLYQSFSRPDRIISITMLVKQPKPDMDSETSQNEYNPHVGKRFYVIDSPFWDWQGVR